MGSKIICNPILEVTVKLLKPAKNKLMINKHVIASATGILLSMRC